MSKNTITCGVASDIKELLMENLMMLNLCLVLRTTIIHPPSTPLDLFFSRCFLFFLSMGPRLLISLVPISHFSACLTTKSSLSGHDMQLGMVAVSFRTYLNVSSSLIHISSGNSDSKLFCSLYIASYLLAERTKHRLGFLWTS